MSVCFRLRGLGPTWSGSTRIRSKEGTSLLRRVLLERRGFPLHLGELAFGMRNHQVAMPLAQSYLASDA
jgi:hypothetical protein